MQIIGNQIMPSCKNMLSNYACNVYVYVYVKCENGYLLL